MAKKVIKETDGIYTDTRTEYPGEGPIVAKSSTSLPPCRDNPELYLQELQDRFKQKMIALDAEVADGSIEGWWASGFGWCYRLPQRAKGRNTTEQAKQDARDRALKEVIRASGLVTTASTYLKHGNIEQAMEAMFSAGQADARVYPRQLAPLVVSGRKKKNALDAAIQKSIAGGQRRTASIIEMATKHPRNGRTFRAHAIDLEQRLVKAHGGEWRRQTISETVEAWEKSKKV